MPSLRIPLVGSLTNRKTDASTNDTTDQKFINCFPEVTKNVITGKQEVILNKRPGFDASVDVQASATGSHAGIVWTTASTFIPAQVVFSFLKSTGTSMMFFTQDRVQVGGDVPNTKSCRFISETRINNVGNLTAILQDSVTGTNEGWYYDEGGAWTQITDGDFIGISIMPPHAHLDGYMFIMTTNGKIYHSDVNTLANWNPASYITVSLGGNGYGVCRYRNFIVGVTDYGLEFFYNAGNSTGSVLSRVQDGVINIGVQLNGSGIPHFKAVADSVYWVGQEADTGRKGIYRLNGMKAEKISNAAVDRVAAAGGVSIILGSFSMHGMTHVAFLTTGTPIYCYCVDTGMWWYLTLGASITPEFMLGATGGTFNSEAFIGTSTNAKVYSSDPVNPVWQDNTSTYTMTVQTGADDLNTYKKKYFHELALLGDSQTSTSAISVSYSDDDFSSFTSAGSIDMNTVPPPKLIRLGASRKRAWKLTHSAATPCRLKTMQINYTEGVS